MENHPIFHVSFLRRYHHPDYVFPGRRQRAPPPDVTAKGEYCEVESDLNDRGEWSSKEFHVLWKGYGAENDTYLYTQVLHAPQLLTGYLARP